MLLVIQVQSGRCMRHKHISQYFKFQIGSLASYRRTAVSAGSAGAGSPAPCELALYLRTVIVAAGFVEAGCLAPCELTLRLRAVVVLAGFLAAGSPAP